MLMWVLHCLQDGAEDDMDMDDDDGPMRIVRNYQRHDARWVCKTQVYTIPAVLMHQPPESAACCAALVVCSWFDLASVAVCFSGASW